MAKKKQLKKRAKSRKSMTTKARASGAQKPESRKSTVEAGNRNVASRVGEVVWTRRSAGHRIVIVVVIMLIVGLLGVLLAPSGGKREEPLTERQREAKETMEFLQAVMGEKQWAFDELEAFLGRPLPEGESEILAASQAADRWGQAFSYLKLKTTSDKVPEWLWYFKEFLPIAAVLSTEAAENIALLATASPQHRPDLFAQAKRFLALARSAEASTYLLIKSVGDVPGPLPAPGNYPLVADDVLAEFPDAPSLQIEGVKLPNPSAMAGLPGDQLSRAATQPAPQWAKAINNLVNQDAITETNTSFCNVVIDEKNGTRAPLSTYLDFFVTFRQIADDLARLTPPEGGLVEAAGTIRAYRTYEEAAVVGRLLTSAPELSEKLRLKLFRVTAISGNQWVWVRSIGQDTGIYFIGFPACSTGEEFHKWIMLTPWDAREELKRELGITD